MILQRSLQNLCGKPGQLPSVENTLLAIKNALPAPRLCYRILPLSQYHPFHRHGKDGTG